MDLSYGWVIELLYPGSNESWDMGGPRDGVWPWVRWLVLETASAESCMLSILQVAEATSVSIPEGRFRHCTTASTTVQIKGVGKMDF